MTHRNAAILTAGGGALMAVGSLLPWVSARTGLGSLDVPGTSGDGVITLIIGAIVGLVGIVNLDRPIAPVLRLLVVLGGIVGVAIFALDYMAAAERVSSVDSEMIAASVGAGLYIVGVGSVATVIGGLRMGARRDPASTAPTALASDATPPNVWTSSGYPGSNMLCGRCGKPLGPAWRDKCNHCGATYTEFPPVGRDTPPLS